MSEENESIAGLNALFAICASKRVTNTDKRKSAYVLTRDQVEVLEKAGLVIRHESQSIEVKLVGEDTTEVTASYYLSIREGANRTPEPRMGRNFISSWLQVGDKVTLATDGVAIFAFRDEKIRSDPEPVSCIRAAAKRMSTSRLRQLLPSPNAAVPRRTVSRYEFVRSTAVVELALRRAASRCEFPECTASLFRVSGGDVYLEVHHVVWLREGGVDALENVAALCPHCHRALHSAHNRAALKSVLQSHIATLPKEIVEL